MPTRPTSVRRALALLCGCLLPACAGDSAEMNKRLQQLQDRVTRLQSGFDRVEDRLAAVEAGQMARVEAARDSSETRHLERPRLKVIRVEPGGPTSASPPAGPAAEPADLDGPRPLIKGKGDDIIKTGDEEPPAKPAPRSVLGRDRGRAGRNG